MRISFIGMFNTYEVTEPLWKLEKYVSGRTHAAKLANNKLYWDNYYQYQSWEDNESTNSRSRYFYRAVLGYQLTSNVDAEKARNNSLDKYLKDVEELGQYKLYYAEVNTSFCVHAKAWEKGVPPSSKTLPRKVYFQRGDLLLVRVDGKRVDVELVKRGSEVINESSPAIASLRRPAWNEREQLYCKEAG